MKKCKLLIIISFICIGSINRGNSQNALPFLETTSIKSIPMIIPTLSNLEKLCDLTESEFKSTMLKYGYHKEDKQFTSYDRITYSNGNIDPFVYKCFNLYSYVLTAHRIEYMSHIDNTGEVNGYIANLVRELNGFYETTTNDGYDIFIHNNFVIAIGRTTGFYRVVIRKQN